MMMIIGIFIQYQGKYAYNGLYTKNFNRAMFDALSLQTWLKQ